MNIEKSKNAKEAIEYLRELFKGDITINGMHVSDELIQEVVYDRLDMIEKEQKYLKKKNKEISDSVDVLIELFDMYIDNETDTIYYSGGDYTLDHNMFKKIERLF